MLPVVFGPAAQAELLEVQDWYSAQNSELAARFAVDIDPVVERIATAPQHFRLSTETSAGLGAGVFHTRCSFG